MARLSLFDKAKKEEGERKRLLEWKNFLRDYMTEKHPKLLFLDKSRIARLQKRAIFLNYIQGEGKKLVSHAPIQFAEKEL